MSSENKSSSAYPVTFGEVGAVPIVLRAEGLSKVVGFYNSLGKTNVAETHERLNSISRAVFKKTFGVRELIESGMSESAADQMADDFYFGTQHSRDDTDTHYNPDRKSFIREYKGKTNKNNRLALASVLNEERKTFLSEAQLSLDSEIIEVIQPVVLKHLPQRVVLAEDKTILPRHTEVVQAASYGGISGEDKITLNRLIKLAGQDIMASLPIEAVPPSIATIKGGLYIPPHDSRYAKAQQLVKVGVFEGIERVGVVFPADEFPKVARSPRDLARHMQAKTRRANEANEDLDDVFERTGRSAGHVLEDKIVAMGALSMELTADQDFLRKMRGEVGNSWIAHYKSKNLERHRVRTDEMIHDTADIAAINLNPGSTEIKRLHDEIKKLLYGGNHSHAEIAQIWHEYITLVGKYIGMRLNKIEISVKLTGEELGYYQPFLDRNQAAA